MSKKYRVYVGGSFDPVHIGHIQLAQMIQQSLTKLKTNHDIYFLPTAGSPLKNTQTNIEQRLKLLEIAIKNTSFKIENYELQLTPPVYSIDTLTHLQNTYPDDCIIFVMGLDSLHSLPKWKNGLQLTKHCHLWVFNRDTLSNTSFNTKTPQKTHLYENDNTLSDKMLLSVPDLLKSDVLFDLPSLLTYSKGKVFLDTRTPTRVSSSFLRKQLSQNRHTNAIKNLFDSDVWTYIINHELYQN